MRIGGLRRSGNIEDRRGMSVGTGLAGGGLGAIVLALVAMFFGVDPSIVLEGMPPQQAQQVEQRVPAREDKMAERSGRRYEKPTLVLFSGAVQSACGFAQAAVGPFYCPADRKLYIDLAFYRDLQDRFKAPGDFAQAYVIAHEVGHHVQNLLGIAAQVRAAQRRGGQSNANTLSVRMELQADCLAGVWAAHADRSTRILEQGDIEEGLGAAAAVGDDRMQKSARGYVSPDSFTHGSSQQRVRWFRRGLESGEMKACDTFSAAQL
jgi:predicted metalloprotease